MAAHPDPHSGATKVYDRSQSRSRAGLWMGGIFALLVIAGMITWWALSNDEVGAAGAVAPPAAVAPSVPAPAAAVPPAAPAARP